MAYSVLIADDHPVVLSGLRALIDAEPDFTVVSTAGDGAAATDELLRLGPDIAVLDFRMPLQSGLEVLARARSRDVRTHVVILAAAATDDEIHSIVTAGARGLVFKDSAPQTLIDCLRMVMQGATWMPEGTDKLVSEQTKQKRRWQSQLASLTHREVEIVRLVSSGCSNKEISFQLQIGEGTVKVHLHNIFVKLDVASRAELAAQSQRQIFELGTS